MHISKGLLVFNIFFDHVSVIENAFNKGYISVCKEYVVKKLTLNVFDDILIYHVMLSIFCKSPVKS